MATVARQLLRVREQHVTPNSLQHLPGIREQTLKRVQGDEVVSTAEQLRAGRLLPEMFRDGVVSAIL